METDIVSLRKAGIVLGDIGRRYGTRVVEALEYHADYPNGGSRRVVLDEDGDLMVFAEGPMIRYTTGKEHDHYGLNAEETTELPSDAGSYLEYFLREPEELEDALGLLDREYLFR